MGHVQGLGDLAVDGPGLDARVVPQLLGVLGNICGVCCTANEVAMRHGIPMAGNFLQQENVVLTGACETST